MFRFAFNVELGRMYAGYGTADTGTKYVNCVVRVGTQTPYVTTSTWHAVRSDLRDWLLVTAEPKVPKSWRWYDVFRTWSEPKALMLLDRAKSVILRAQERQPVGQHRKQKRRAYVQMLHAL